jgi:hypothetical protein
MADTSTDTAPASAPETPDPGMTAQDQALFTLAKDEDAAAYVQERADQLAEENGEKTETRISSVEKALEIARAQTREAREQSDGLDKEYAQAEAEWQAQQAQEIELERQRANELSYHEARGRTMERGAQLLKTNPEAHAKITENLTVLESVLDDQQRLALEMALVHCTDAAWNLGLKLGDESDGTTMAQKMELIRNTPPEQILQAAWAGAQQIQQERYIQTRIMQDRAARGRTQTSAPPPINPPRGSASAPRDMQSLARKDNAADYIKMRMAQEKRSREG